MSSGLYHINPSTGDPGKCSAKLGNCPFGSADEHYTSSEAAREAFEELTSKAAKEASLKAWKRRPKPAPKTEPSVSSGSSHGRAGGGHGQSSPAPTPKPTYSGHGRPAYNTGHGSSGHGR